MEKIKHTKTELKHQKDGLKRFTRYLPTLILKKQHLQMEILRTVRALEELTNELNKKRESIDKWVALFAEDVKIEELLQVEKVYTEIENIAGIDIPVFEKIDFIEKEYDFIRMPLWVDYGIEALKEFIELNIRLKITNKQEELLREELRITTQRVNLFEKVKIPQAQENIRSIQIVLGDMQTAAVVTGKISKRKIELKEKALIQA